MNLCVLFSSKHWWEGVSWKVHGLIRINDAMGGTTSLHCPPVPNGHSPVGEHRRNSYGNTFIYMYSNSDKLSTTSAPHTDWGSGFKKNLIQIRLHEREHRLLFFPWHIFFFLLSLTQPSFTWQDLSRKGGVSAGISHYVITCPFEIPLLLRVYSNRYYGRIGSFSKHVSGCYFLFYLPQG